MTVTEAVAAGYATVHPCGTQPPTASNSALVPARLLDTRPGNPTVDGVLAGGGIAPQGTVTAVQVAGRGGVPTGVATAVLNVTVTEPADAGCVTVYPCGIAIPLASNLNFVPGQTIPNAVLSRVADDGTVCIFNNQRTHVIADVMGYYP
jgi:hypothetical protein